MLFRQIHVLRLGLGEWKKSRRANQIEFIQIKVHSNYVLVARIYRIRDVFPVIYSCSQSQHAKYQFKSMHCAN